MQLQPCQGQRARPAHVRAVRASRCQSLCHRHPPSCSSGDGVWLACSLAMPEGLVWSAQALLLPERLQSRQQGQVQHGTTEAPLLVVWTVHLAPARGRCPPWRLALALVLVWHALVLVLAPRRAAQGQPRLQEPRLCVAACHLAQRHRHLTAGSWCWCWPRSDGPCLSRGRGDVSAERRRVAGPNDAESESTQGAQKRGSVVTPMNWWNLQHARSDCSPPPPAAELT